MLVDWTSDVATLSKTFHFNCHPAQANQDQQSEKNEKKMLVRDFMGLRLLELRKLLLALVQF